MPLTLVYTMNYTAMPLRLVYTMNYTAMPLTLGLDLEYAFDTGVHDELYCHAFDARVRVRVSL